VARLVALHSFRRGTGKSTLAANLAGLLAASGRRVGLVDANLEAPSLALLFGLEAPAPPTFDDFLAERAALSAVAREITGPPAGRGRLFLIPAAGTAAFHRDRGNEYDLERCDRDLRAWAADLKLDAVFIDTRAGINEESMLALSVADRAAIILRLDKQDYQGTAVVIDLARKLELPQPVLVVNPTPLNYDPRQVLAEVEKTYACPVVGVLPFAEELLTHDNASLFVLSHPTHPLTQMLGPLANQLISAD
jgi:MinD-like ATPase involved in chromosome partitioning or flagellar assembly